MLVNICRFYKKSNVFQACSLIENKLKVIYMFHIQALRIVNETVGRDCSVPEFIILPEVYKLGIFICNFNIFSTFSIYMLYFNVLI